ncbi:MAG: hypothetical protein RLZZ450_3461 [Pseudomonadota bacterium]|jgi:hypothetical protein
MTYAQHADDAPTTELGQADAARPSEQSAGPLTLGPLHLSMFVDAYAAWQTGGTGTLATLSEHRAFSGQGSTLRSENGFALSFLGFDVLYDAGGFGAVASMRFGSAANIFHSQSDSVFGVNYLTQAYALYRPLEQLELDLGMFMSPFGYEALESWKNPNYTISALYTYGQPNWHTGFRAAWQVNDDLSLMGLLVNGANNISETQQQGGLDQKPMVGGSVSYRVSSALSLTLGGLLAVDSKHNDDEGFDGFADFVATLQLGALSTALNVDYIYTGDGAPSGADRNYIGGSLTSGYRFHEVVGIAARGEYMRDDANYDGKDVWQLATGTLTLDVEPIAGLSYLVLRWENRWEKSNQRVFGKNSRGTEDIADDTYRRTWFESVLGVVVTTDP